MKFYDSVGPNPRVVRMFAAEKHISFDEIEAIDIIAGDNRRPPYMPAVNPLGGTPALVLPSGQVITEILAICEYLEERQSAPALIGATPEERANTRMWLRRVDLGFVEPLVLGFRAAEGREMFAARVLLARAEAAPDLKAMSLNRLDWLESSHGGADYLAGEAFTIADILLYCFVDFALLIGMTPLQGRPWLSAWFSRVSARPSSKA
ncbi:glutathione S-transferase family protein [Hydrocarboniphaga sp.]|uniref:glutathione S-transferase family protein n=1 Tax=Hydrocarboniphaga sp. TaxID=2033016 RepID=UPI003D0F6BE4